MRTNIGKALSCFVVAALISVAQFGAATPADAKRGVRAHGVRHARVNRVRVKHAHVHHYNRHRVARGVAAGVATGVVISSAARYNTCSNLTYRCNRGEIWACIEHDNRCY